MRIFSKKSFQFDHPAGEQPAETVLSQSFNDVPDWVEESAMFKLAVADGDVQVIASRQDEIDAELNSPDRSKRAKAAEEKAKKKAEAEAAAAAEEAAKAAAEEAAKLAAQQNQQASQA